MLLCVKQKKNKQFLPFPSKQNQLSYSTKSLKSPHALKKDKHLQQITCNN